MLGPIARFAGQGLKVLYPGLSVGPSVMSKASLAAAAPDIAMDLAPNLLFAGLTAASLPGADEASGFTGATTGERVAAGAFDVGTSTIASMLGRFGGKGISKLARRQSGGRGDMMLTNFGGMGAEAALWGSGLISNPGINSSLDRFQQAQLAAEEQNKRAYREQLIKEIEEEQRTRNQALQGYGGSGALLSDLGLQLPMFGGYG